MREVVFALTDLFKHRNWKKDRFVYSRKLGPINDKPTANIILSKQNPELPIKTP